MSRPVRPSSPCRTLLVLALAVAAPTPGAATISWTQTTVRLPVGSCPVLVTHPGGRSRMLLVLDKDGRVWRRNPANPATVLATPFLDLEASVVDSGCDEEVGMLGLAFHPGYATNHFVYVYYTTNGGAQKIERIDVSLLAADGTPPPAARRPVLVMCDPAGNHNGGMLAFGPFDGYLYVGTGDGGGGCDDSGAASGAGCVAAPAGPHAQNTGTLLGKILRLDVDGDDFPGDPDRNYAIPPDNPFVGQGGADEVWTLGLRNPWRFSFDRCTGDLWIGDVGQFNHEEIDRLPAAAGGVTAPGLNLGWLCCEGAHNARMSCSVGGPVLPAGWGAEDCGFSTCMASNGSYRAPVIDVDRDVTTACAIVGGYRYRGLGVRDFEDVPAAPAYVFTDYCSSRAWLATFDGTRWVPSEIADFPFTVHSMGEDAQGNLWITHQDNGPPLVRRLTDAGGIFADNFELGDALAWSQVAP